MPPLETAGVRRKLQRLGTMSGREIAHRIREKGYTELRRFGLVPNDPDLEAGPDFRRYLMGQPATSFYAGPRQNLRQRFRAEFPEWITRAREDADRLCRHEFQFLRHESITLPAVIDWHRDPITGRAWERLFWTAYNPELNHDGRDAKNIHELNRHQHLTRLAKAWYLTGEKRYAAEAVTQMLGWIEQNPTDIGINWQSSLEIGIRAISWLWTIFLLLPSESFTEDAASQVGASLLAQLEHVFRHTSEFSSPNTHLIGEAAALFIGGMVFRDRKRAAAWMDKGAALLESEVRNQVLDDGVDAELSSYYHCYALDFIAQAVILAEQNQYPLDPVVRQKVADMARFVVEVSRQDGTLPLLGDDDGGRALALQERDYRTAAGLLALVPGGPPTEETFWFLGSAASVPATALVARSEAFFPNGGYAIQRSERTRLIFDCGGLGMLTGGHSHADALGIVLSKDGHDILADPGTVVYNCAPEWRNYFRSTRAHNTVVIDGRDQAERSGTFAWKDTLTVRRRQADRYYEGEHDGYLSVGVVHRRRVIPIAPEFWVIADDFRGTGEHTFDFHYHFGRAVGSPRRDGASFHDESLGFSLGIFASHPLRAELLHGETDPIEGWVSSGYGEKHPAFTVRMSAAGSVPAAALTLLSTGEERPVFRQVSVSYPETVACVSTCGVYEDIVVASGGDFFWSRQRRGVVEDSLAIGEGAHLLEALCAQSAAS